MHEVGFVLPGKLDAARAGCGPGHDDEAIRREELTHGAAERGVVVDDENPSAHAPILPATAVGRSVASPTLFTGSNTGGGGR